MQRRLWFVDQVRPGDVTYNIPVKLRVRGGLDTGGLQAALDAVVARHDALRTRFLLADGEPAQEIVPDARAGVDIVDLRRRENAEDVARAYASAEARRPFDLTECPLLRCVVVHLTDDEQLVLFTMHHIVFDGLSADVFFEDLSAVLAGGPAALSGEVAQFGELVAWERAAVESGAQDELVRWWTEGLTGAPTVLDLVTDRARPAVQGHNGDRRTLTVPADVVDALDDLGRARGVTPFMTLLAAFGVVLARHAGQDEVLVGAPVAFRPRSGFERSIGCFLNTVVMRIDTGGQPSFAELLARVKNTVLHGFEHQEAPFERLVAELAPEHDLSRTPLVQVMLSIEPEPVPPNFPGCTTEHIPNDTVTAKFDLSLYAHTSAGRIDLELVYDTDLFSGTRAGWLLEQTGALLTQVARNPHRSVLGYPLLSDESRDLLPDPYEPLTPSWPGSLLDRVAKYVDGSPDRTAMTHKGETWSYADLDRAANQLAGYLRQAGVQRGDMVGIVVKRDPSTQIAMLAALKCAAPFVIMDWTLPAARLAQCVAVSAPKAIVLTRGCEPLPDEVAAAGPEPAEVVRLDDPAWTTLPAEEVNAGLGPDDPIYAVFTSGSTGVPKCVVTRHDAVMHFLDWYERSQRLGPHDRFAVLAGLGYEVLMRDLLTPMWVGGCSSFPHHDRLDFAGTAGWLRETGATVVHLTPPYANELAAAMPRGGLPDLRLAGINGDVLRRGTAVAWAAAAPHATLINIYGATETPQVISALPLRDPSSPDGIMPFSSKSPIGPGIDGVQVLAVNPAGELCAQGEIGELVVRTPYLAGYLGGIAGGFTTSPWTGDPEDRVYRTGDRVRYLGDGCAEFVGRTDHQVKLRGHRIEPGDIESALLAHQRVGQALVLVREDRPGDRRLVAYVTPMPGGEAPTVPELRARASTALPKPMVPAAFVVLPGFPLTANGKVDRAALPAPSREQELGHRSRPPEGDVELRLAALWEDVLAVEGVGAEDDFFELGGHSLLLTRLLTRVGEAFGVRLSLLEVFEAPTVAGFAALVERKEPEPDAAEPVAVSSSGDGTYGLSMVQRRLWFVDQVQPGDVSYNMSTVLRVRGTLDLAAFQSALDAVVARHGALRTRFTMSDGESVQEVVPGVRVRVDVVDMRDRADAEQVGRAYAEGETRRPFDLSAAPLMRCAVVRLPGDAQLVTITVHHIVFDGWSASVFFEDLSAALAGGLDGPVSQLADLVEWERTSLEAAEQDRLVAWWKERLAGAPTIVDLVTDRARPAVQAHRGARRRFTVPDAVVAGLREVGRAHGATLFMTLLSAFGVVVTRNAGQDEVLVGTPVAFRPRPDFERSIGCFLNTVVMRVDTRGRPSFNDLLSRVKDGALTAFDHQRVPFERLVAELAPGNDLSRNPLYQVLFALQNVPEAPLTIPEAEVETLDAAEAHAQCDLSLRFTESDRGLVGMLDYDVDLFEAATVDRLVGQLLNVLAEVARDPATPVHRLALLGAGERERLVHGWNDTSRDYPLDRTLPVLIADQVRRTPGAPAVRFGGEELTYAELDRRANRLALRLRERGVGPDVVVGVHMRRSVELPVALLGVLKAGGAYLPLEPEHPVGRLRAMIESSAAPVVLTHDDLAGTFPTEIVVGAETAEEGPEPSAHPDGLAYVIYTSGSTGVPKGVQITHRGIVNRLVWMQDAYALTPRDRVLQKTPIDFDVSIWELFWPLLTGACLVLAEPRRHRDPGYLAGLMASTGITVCHFVPVMLRAFLDTADTAGLTGLRLIVCSGEELPADVARRCLEMLNVRLENLYGPTEASVDVTAWTCEPGSDAPRVPIGAPIANTRAHVLDNALQLCPVGVTGELYLGGTGLARGYHGRAALTAERFVADPLGRPGARLYRTGDRARRLPGGALEFLGRTDHQVKVRGFRIEPGEIEQVLRRHAAVGQALVVVREDRPGDRRLVAYLTLRPDTAPPPPVVELRSLVASVLPAYMVPSAFVVMDEFPVASSGKVDQGALPAPVRDPAAPSRPPATEEERMLAVLWKDVLGVANVGAEEDFFELGGDSMHAVALAGRARERGFDITVEALFRAPTIAAQARSRRGPDADATAGIGEFALLSDEDRARLNERS
ncbi:non-ribosomal peptide synthetase [Actinomadura litoris]|uniref:non-ribosomal peptide synthetase n=1 Tax=Actinomadura litoris TaxID=2678616 RepID=UPI001FA6DECA|nr:non-ribosomal peptide synthetase [Actinomadura litoris]